MIPTMADRSVGRIVYSTGAGRMCPECGQAVAACRCSSRDAMQTMPAKIVAKLRVEKKGRSGKTVTVVDGLPQNDPFLKALCQELKRGCGTGGTVSDGAVELQGDQRDRVREMLLAKAFAVKG
jgi:translation initiation factor 1